jgi:hypothetical protein
MEPEGQGYVNQDGPELDLVRDKVDIKSDLVSEALVYFEKQVLAHKEILHEARVFVRIAEEAQAKFGGEVRLMTWMGVAKALLTIDVKDFKEATPIIEWLEEVAHLKCNETNDSTWFGPGARNFSFGPSFQLTADLTKDATCKKVIVGYEAVEPRAIYEFKCTEAQ